MYKIFVSAFLMLSTLTLSAQKHAVQGLLEDNDQQSLIGAVAVILQPQDSVMIGFSTTDTDGKFKIDNINTGEYLLQLTYIGYGTIERTIELKSNQLLLDLGKITMYEDSELLDAVTVSAEYIPIKITKDTMEFNADAFKTRPNAVVEDLLKLLPGVEISDDGTITVRGEEVKAVTVDGKDFFGTDPKMATKNLPAEAVKKVQAYERKSKTSEFTGISDGNDEMILNLQLKPEMRKGSFGNVMGGYGTDNRYEGKAMLNRFGATTQVSLLGGLNNTNNTGIDVNDYATMMGSGRFGRGGGRFGSSGLPLSFGQNNSGETKSITAGMNLNQELGKKGSRMTFSYFLTDSKTDLRQSSLTNSFLPSGTLITNKINNSNSDNLNHNFNTNFEVKIDSTTEMSFRGSLALRNGNSISSALDTTFNANYLLANLNNQSRNNKTESNNYNLSLNLRKRLNKPGRTVTLDGSLGANNSENTYRLLSQVYGMSLVLNDSLSVFQDQLQNSGNSNYSFGATYTEPLSNSLYLIAKASRRNNNSDIDKEFFDLNPDDLNSLAILNEELSRLYDNTFTYTTGGLNFRLNKTSYSASFGADFQNSHLDGKPSIGLPIDQTFNNILPKATLELDKINMRFNYSTSVREPTIDQLQPVLDNTNPLQLYQGNPDLVPEYRHNLRIMYSIFDQFNFRGLFANVRLGYTKNRITTSTILDRETFVRKQIPVNTSGEKTIASSINYSSPLNIIQAKYRIGLNSSLTSGINFIDGISNDINRWSNGINFTLENKSKKNIDASIGGRFNLNNNIYVGNSAQNTSFFNQIYNAALTWYAGKGWVAGTNFDYYIYDAGSFDKASRVNLWQASVSKNFLNDKLTAKIRVFDILNQNKGVFRNASETQISEDIANSIGRYGMLSVSYNLSALGR